MTGTDLIYFMANQDRPQVAGTASDRTQSIINLPHFQVRSRRSTTLLPAAATPTTASSPPGSRGRSTTATRAAGPSAAGRSTAATRSGRRGRAIRRCGENLIGEAPEPKRVTTRGICQLLGSQPIHKKCPFFGQWQRKSFECSCGSRVRPRRSRAAQTHLS